MYLYSTRVYIIKVCEYKNNLTLLHKRLKALGYKGFFCVTSFFANLHERSYFETYSYATPMTAV